MEPNEDVGNNVLSVERILNEIIDRLVILEKDVALLWETYERKKT